MSREDFVSLAKRIASELVNMRLSTYEDGVCLIGCDVEILSTANVFTVKLVLGDKDEVPIVNHEPEPEPDTPAIK